uniref:Major facilitator superfamily (MFS) profile domain-containing protein n=1 Tax=Anolis carolinensis TaxID=28377 RepID=A0A803SND8_ANOCA
MSGVGEVIKALDDFGRFQHCLVALLTLNSISHPFHIFGQLFMVAEEPHYCRTTWFSAIGSNLTEEERLNLTLPRKSDGSLEECSMFTPVERDLDAIVQYGLNATETCREGWVYPSKREPSLVTQFDLVCDRKDLNSISQSIFILGNLAGALVFSALSDRFGRRPVTLLAMLIQGIAGVAITFVPNFIVHVALRFIVGISISGVLISGMALGAEWVGTAYRPLPLIINHVGFSVGQMVLAGLAYAIRDWRKLQIVGSAPVLALFFYVWVLPESPRWLVTKGRIEEAKKLFQKAAAVNKRSIPPKTLDQLKPEKEAKSRSILDLARHSHLRKVTFLISTVWFANSLAYYGLSLNVGSFGLNIYLTQLIFGAVEIPGRSCTFFVMRCLGRKKCQSFFLLLGGAVCLLIPVIPKDLPVVITVLAVIGKFTISGSFTTSYVYTTELFPTVIRQVGIAVCQTVARVAAVSSPLARLLEKYHPSIPLLIFGGTAIGAGILTFFLPETQGKELPDYMDDVIGNQKNGDEHQPPESDMTGLNVRGNLYLYLYLYLLN